MDTQDAVTALSALAHGSRLDIFRLLVRAGPAGLTVSHIAARLELPWATLSHHLAQLRRAGLVRVTRLGRQAIQAADYGVMTDLLAYLTANCCQGADTNLELETTP